MNEPLNFGDARTMIDQQRARVSRKPVALPLEKDLETLKNSLHSTIRGMSSLDNSEVTISRYIELTNVVCTRLTLLNILEGQISSCSKIQKKI